MPNGKHPSGDKTFGFEPAIGFYEIEYGEKLSKKKIQKYLSYTTQA